MKRMFAAILAASVPALGSTAIAGEITFWHSFTQPVRIAAMEESAASFKAETGHTVNLEVVPWNKVEEKWTTAAAGGTLPDVSICLPSVCMDMNEAGVLRSLDGVLGMMGGTDAFASQAMLTSFDIVDDTLISLPFYSHARLLIYRKDIFEELGVEPPNTWDEMIAVAEATTSAPDRYGMVQFLDAGDTGTTQYLFLVMQANGGTFLGPDGNASFNTPGNVEAVRTLLKLYEVGSPAGELTLSYHNDLFDTFTSGKTVMVFDTAFLIGISMDKAPDLVDKLGFAAPPSGSQTPWRIGHVGVTVFESDNGDITDEWLAFLYRDDNYIRFVHTIPAGMYPVTKSAADNPEFFAHPVIERFSNAAKLTLEGVANGTDIGVVHGPNRNVSAVYGSGIIERRMQDIILNGADVEAAVADAHDEIQTLIDRTANR